MKLSTSILTITFALLSISCGKQTVEPELKKNELLEFANANCFFWYFKKKNYETDDITAITGGIVETGSLSAEKYQRTALLVKEYKPQIHTKNDIDIDLLKCFKLSDDADFLEQLDKLN